MDRYLTSLPAYSTLDTQCATLLEGGACSAGCKTMLTTMTSLLGCCTTPAINLDLSQLASRGWNILKQVNLTCGLNLAPTGGNGTLVGSCSKYLIAGTLTIKNFIYEWYTSYITKATAAIKSDLALKLGVRVDMIVINRVVDATVTGGNSTSPLPAISVSYTVSPGSTWEAKKVNSALTTQLSVETTLSITSALDLASRQDPTLPASADTTSSSQTTITNPDASNEAIIYIDNGVDNVSSGMRIGVSLVAMVAAMAFALLL
jgi:hypothetical protein